MNTFPRSIIHKNLVLLPNRDNIQTHIDLRPINLSKLINKVISKVVHDRFENLIPQIISFSQSSFVKERRIIENVLLTRDNH